MIDQQPFFQQSPSTDSRLRWNDGGAGHTMGKGDSFFLVIVAALIAIGIVMLYSASSIISDRSGSDMGIMFRQFLMFLFGVGAMGFGMYFPVERYRGYINRAMLFVIVLMVAQLVVGPTISNTRRWLDLGPIHLQTSELARCLLIIFVAKVLTETPEILRQMDREFGIFLGILALPMVLTALQPHLSGTMAMAVVIAMLLFLAGMKVLPLIGIALVAVSGAALLMLRNEYQRQRLTDFFTSWGTGTDSYQLLQSKISFGSGGIFGAGLGNSSQKMFFLPEPHTDFIYSIIGEELGLIGAVIILALFIFLFARSVRICMKQNDQFRFLLGSGLAGTLILYALVHIAVTVGIVPLTGLPLPFISKGGTSLVVSLWSVGVLWNLSRSSIVGMRPVSSGRDFQPVNRVVGE